MNKEYLQRIAGIKSVGQLNESIGGYVDLRPLKEVEVEESFNKGAEDIAMSFSNTDPNTPKGATAGEEPMKTNELEKPEKIYADDDDVLDTDKMLELGGNDIDMAVSKLVEAGFDPEDILDLCKMYIEAHSEASMNEDKDQAEKDVYNSSNGWNNHGEIGRGMEEAFDFEQYDDTDLNGSSAEAAIDGLIGEYQNIINSEIKDKQEQSYARIAVKKLWKEKIDAWKGGESVREVEASGEADEELKPSSEFDWDV